MEEQPTNRFPTLREVREMEEEQQEHVFPPPKPYVAEVKQTTRFDRQSTLIAKARLESTVGAL